MLNEYGNKDEVVQLLRFKKLDIKDNEYTSLLLMYCLYIPELEGKYIVLIKSKYSCSDSQIEKLIGTDELLKSKYTKDIELISYLSASSLDDLNDLFNEYK